MIATEPVKPRKQKLQQMIQLVKQMYLPGKNASVNKVREGYTSNNHPIVNHATKEIHTGVVDLVAG